MMQELYFISGIGLGYFIKDVINIITSKKPRKKPKETAIPSKTSIMIFQMYLKMPKNPNGFVSKTDLISTLMKELKLSRAQIYRIYAKEKHLFLETKIGRSTYLKELEV